MGVLATVGSGLRSASSDITGMRTPRRLDFLPLVENQPPPSSNTEQPPSKDAAASTRLKRTTRDLIYFAGAGLAAASAGAAPGWGGCGAASAGTVPKLTAPPFLRKVVMAWARLRRPC